MDFICICYIICLSLYAYQLSTSFLRAERARLGKYSVSLDGLHVWTLDSGILGLRLYCVLGLNVTDSHSIHFEASVLKCTLKMKNVSASQRKTLVSPSRKVLHAIHHPYLQMAIYAKVHLPAAEQQKFKSLILVYLAWHTRSWESLCRNSSCRWDI